MIEDELFFWEFVWVEVEECVVVLFSFGFREGFRTGDAYLFWYFMGFVFIRFSKLGGVLEGLIFLWFFCFRQFFRACVVGTDVVDFDGGISGIEAVWF